MNRRFGTAFLPAPERGDTDVDRTTFIVSAALMGLLIVEFVWLELRARRTRERLFLRPTELRLLA